MMYLAGFERLQSASKLPIARDFLVTPLADSR